MGSRLSFLVQAGRPGVVENRFVMFLFYFSASSEGVMFGMSQNSFRLMYQTHRRVTQRCTETYIRLLFVHGPGTRTFKFVFLIKRHQEVR